MRLLFNAWKGLETRGVSLSDREARSKALVGEKHCALLMEPCGRWRNWLRSLGLTITFLSLRFLLC